MRDPQFTSSVWPVMPPDASEIRNMTTWATSSGEGIRPSGALVPSDA
jgi:hypothetical protein